MNSPKVIVLVLNYNNEEDTQACVASLFDQDYSNFSILLLDNHSENFDGLRKKYFQNDLVDILEFDRNLGFAKAHNKALEQIFNKGIDFDYIAMLNNDAVASESWLNEMVACAQHHNCDLVSSKILIYSEPSKLDNTGHKMLNTGEIIPVGHMEPGRNHNKEHQNLGPCAAAALYSRKLVDHIGLFDPYFETGYEDAEYGVRATLAGYKSFYCPKAVVRHKISRSVNKIDNRDYRIQQQVNIFYSYFKLFPLTVLLINLPFILIKYFLVLVVEILLFRFSYVMIHLKSLIRLYSIRKLIFQKRKEVSRKIKLIQWYRILNMQEFFLWYDITRLYRFTLGKKQNVFDKSLNSYRENLGTD